MSGSSGSPGSPDDGPVPERGREIIVRAARPRGVDTRILSAFASEVLDACGVGRVSLGIKLTTDRVVRRMNRRFRGVDHTTDVLSFEGDDADGGPPCPRLEMCAFRRAAARFPQISASVRGCCSQAGTRNALETAKSSLKGRRL